MALRWGIASAGKISSDFVTAVSVLPKSDHQVIAVAARNLENAKNFAATHNIPKAYEGYVNLAKDPDVEIVYIGSLNPQHYEICKLMLENGKQVLCEKPFCMNEKQTKNILDLAKSKKLFIMEAIWSRCFPVYEDVKQRIEAGEIGDVKFVSVTFGFNLGQVERIKKKEFGGSSVLDLGVYTLQFQQFAFPNLKPIKIVAAGHLNEFGTDDAATAVLTYPGGKTAVVSTETTVEVPNEGIIVGTKGTIVIQLFHAPTTFTINGTTVEHPLIENEGKFNFPNSAGLAYEAEEVRKCLRIGKLESPKITHENTLQLAHLMDKWRKEIGVFYAEDEV